MKLQQLSLFLENQPGVLRAPMELLASKGINVLTMSLADTTQFGILRFIVADPEVEYMYDFGAACRSGKAAIVFRFENPDEAIAALGKAGVHIYAVEELLR